MERKDQENIQMQKYLEKLMDEDRSKLEKKAMEQRLLRVSELKSKCLNSYIGGTNSGCYSLYVNIIHKQ